MVAGRQNKMEDAKPCLNWERQGGILRLVMDNPPANTLSDNMLDELAASLESAVDDKEVKVIVIAAKGKIFCAGHDLKEMESHRADNDKGQRYFGYLLNKCSAVMQAIVHHPKPIIAEVSGAATAAGCQLVATCDLAFAGQEASFCTPGVNIGLFCSTPMVALSRAVLRKNAMEMLLSGEAISAERAEEIGLVNRVVGQSELSDAVRKCGEKIAGKAAKTLKIGKQAFYKQAEMGMAEAYKFASQVMVENMLDENAKEGIGAFIEHRSPEWKDS